MSLSNASIVRLAKSAPLLAIREQLTAAQVLEQAVAIQQIPAPTFHEKARADYVQSRFEALGLTHVEQDTVHNVYGWCGDPQSAKPALLIAAHTDTVFPFETDLAIQNRPDQIQGAGLGDNSLGVAALLQLADYFQNHAVPYDAPLCFVANTREEGLGDLGGINAALDRLNGRIGAGIIIEGMALGRIYNAGIGVRRYQLEVTGTGGHSWLHFGTPSAIHQLAQFVAAFTSLSLPSQPRTTYNVGLIEGGSSVNTIAARASCVLDLRSDDLTALAQLEDHMQALAEKHLGQGITYRFIQVGNRPSGSIPDDHPLVRLAQAAYAEIQMAGELEAGSTDTNALLAREIPAICVGVTYGGNAHTTDEYIELSPIENGIWQLLLLVAAVSHSVGTWV